MTIRTRSRYLLARDQEEEGLAELRQMLDDGDVDFGDVLAACLEFAPESKREQVYDAVRGLAADQRGPRAWARDRLERRTLDRGLRSRDRRAGARDLTAEELKQTEPGRSRPIEEFRREGEPNSNLSANDLAMDARARRNPSLASFNRRYPGAAKIEPL